jgi:cell division protein FtsL
MIARTLAFAILLVATVATGIGVVYARHQSRLAFIELSRLGNERDDLKVEYGRLQLEQATWAENNRIEQIARGRLGMLTPTVAETVVIRR